MPDATMSSIKDNRQTTPIPIAVLPAVSGRNKNSRDCSQNSPHEYSGGSILGKHVTYLSIKINQQA